MYKFFTLCGRNLYISDHYLRTFDILNLSFAQIPPKRAVFCIGSNLFQKKDQQINTWTCMHGHFKFIIVSRKSEFIYLNLSCLFGDTIQ